MKGTAVRLTQVIGDVVVVERDILMQRLRIALWQVRGSSCLKVQKCPSRLLVNP
jgi:hypothetical protein